ncbi:glycolate oxidase subunit GlcE [Thioalkalicoccus limnaeus]|uniref:Glycolate oxidase subunit GlcE n=1 Tax=Thioalkalicoccus limnaeus TaxID=120681 RepID=A0ABV4BEK6_9GAMM
MNQDRTQDLQAQVRAAARDARALAIRGGGTKTFLGQAAAGEPIALAEHAGVLRYQPEELVLTARAGTPLTEIESALAERGQMLAFEPPHFGPGATLGGTIACGLSGPARAAAGSARDFVLGVRLLNGRGDDLRFGGEVMKNVAGYDLSRLMVGAFGTLGLLLEISLKVLPRPIATRTLVQEHGVENALERMAHWAGQPLPISATCHDGERLFVRLSGAERGVAAAAERIGGDALDDGDAEHLWRDGLREHGHPFFQGDAPLWRLSVPPAAPPLGFPGPQLIEWGGAQRWLRSDAPAAEIRAAASAGGGHATLFRGPRGDETVFHPLPPALHALHRRLKAAFDTAGILNPGRLYPDL